MWKSITFWPSWREKSQLTMIIAIIIIIIRHAVVICTFIGFGTGPSGRIL
jgi:hypothetical protein